MHPWSVCRQEAEGQIVESYITTLLDRARAGKARIPNLAIIAAGAGTAGG